MKCNECQNENICCDGNHELTRLGCAENDWCCFVPITNADKIRSMTDEELAEWLEYRDDNCPRARCPGGSCHDCWIDWLKSPVEEEQT